MIPSTSHHTSQALFNQIKRVENGHRYGSFQESAYKLLKLLFAYKRSQYQLHLRWHKEASNQLAFITLQELSQKKKTDPVLNGIYNALIILAEGNESAVKELLETAEHRINEISTNQRAKATAKRELNPVLKRATHYHEKYPDLSPREIIDRLKSDQGAHDINSFDDELEKFFYNEKGNKYPREKTITRASVQNHISKLRKK